MRRVRRSSQIATILTLAIAAIFLFIVITINIGKVSQKKTAIDNASDGAALLLASSLGSVGSSLKQELELWNDRETGEDRDSDCSPNWALITGIALVIGSIFAAIVTFGIASPGAAAGITAGIGIALSGIAGGYMVASDVLFAAYTEPGLMKQMQDKFQNMTAEQGLIEAAIQSALFSTIDDPAFVPDLYDVDRDGDKMPGSLDKIPQFNHWYFQRLNSLPRIGVLIDEFFYYLFTEPRVFEVDINPESEDADAAHLLVNASWRIADWLRDDFKPFIEEMWDYGYGVEFAADYSESNIVEEKDDLGQLYRDILDFEDAVKEICNLSKDELVASFEDWFTQFDDLRDDSEAEDWYDRMEQWIEHIKNIWVVQLNQQHEQVRYDARYKCCRKTWGCCSDESVTGPGCREECETTCETVCDPECEQVCTTDCWYVEWMACCEEWRCCCRQCGDSNCPPHSTEIYPSASLLDYSTPTGGDRNCCDSACNLITGDRIACNNTRIQPYIVRLEQFIGSIESLRAEIRSIALQAASEKNHPWRDKAIYVWKDVVLDDLGEEVEEEEPVHMVYVKIDLPADFKFPYITQTREWRWWVIVPYPVICKRVEAATGEFDITVARYDEDLAKRGPLSNFWTFKFRRNPAGDEDSRVSLLRSVADRYHTLLSQGRSCSLEALTSQAEFDQLSDLAWDYGIVAKVRAHYGPGYVYHPDDLPGVAAQRNRDIYIVSRER